LELANQIHDLANDLEMMAALHWLEYQLAVLAIAHADLVHDIAWLRSSKSEAAESFLALSVRVVELRNRMVGCAAAIEHFSSRLD
jgi:hypothetical protein